MTVQEKGEKHHNATLSNQDIEEIKEALAGKNYYGRGAALARKYRCSKGHISNIKSGWSRSLR